MSAYGLTEQERVISGLVFHGLSTRAISEKLHITQNTVQDHLKSIFDKTGVRSRRELVASEMRRFQTALLRVLLSPGKETRMTLLAR